MTTDQNDYDEKYSDDREPMRDPTPDERAEAERIADDIAAREAKLNRAYFRPNARNSGPLHLPREIGGRR